MGNQSSSGSSTDQTVMKKSPSASQPNAPTVPVNSRPSGSGSSNPEAPPNYDDIFGAPSSNAQAHNIWSNSPRRATATPVSPVHVPDGLSNFTIPPPSAAAWGTAAPSHHQQPAAPSTGSTPDWRRQEEERAEQAELRMWFGAVDENGDGFITSEELRQALLNDNWTPFNMDTIKMMLKMFDRNMNDRIEFDEFAGLKRYVQEWKKVFDQYDVDHSGTIDVQEIQQAFRGMNYTFSLDFCTLLCRRFSLRSGGQINLDAFIYACAMVNAMSKDYVRLRHTGSLEDFLRTWLNKPAS